jgi:hypothetical protein
MRINPIVPATIAAVALGACSILSSQPVALSPGHTEPGIMYMLPKALVDVVLTDEAGYFSLKVQNPVIVGDEKKTMRLDYNASVLSNDTVKVTLNEKTNLLQAIDITAEDKTAEIIKKIAQTVAIFAQAGVVPGTVVFQDSFEPGLPGEETRLNQAMQKALRLYIETKAEGCNKLIAVTETKDNAAQKAACATYSRVYGDLASVSIKADQLPTKMASATTEGSAAPTPPSPPQPAPSKDGACSVGICYRAVVPYRITATINYASVSTVTYLPNNSPTLSVPLDRFALVTTKHNIVLNNGMLQSVSVDKPSEGLALVSIPLDVMTAIFESLTTFVQAKFDLSEKETALANQRVAQINAENSLDQLLAKEKAKKGNAEAAVLGAEDGVLLEAHFGTAKSPLPSTPTDQQSGQDGEGSEDPNHPSSGGSQGSLGSGH